MPLGQPRLFTSSAEAEAEEDCWEEALEEKGAPSLEEALALLAPPPSEVGAAETEGGWRQEKKRERDVTLVL